MRKHLASLFIPLFLFACANSPQSNVGDVLTVAATFYPLAHFAEQVGGNSITVRQITPSGVEPHDYEPTPLDLAGLQSAKLFLMNGGGLDPWAERVRDELALNGIVVIVMAESMDLDPHLWLDPVIAQRSVRDIRDALIQIDPARAHVYRKNADLYLAKLSALDTAYHDGLASCEIREVVTSHNAFSTLAKRYNLTMFSISGLSPDDEPSPKRMAEIADLAKVKKIDTIFFETLVSPRLPQTIAREIGAKTAVLNSIEGLTEEERRAGKTYISLMEENLTQLRSALRCQ